MTLRIGIVDDAPFIREIIRRIMEKDGHSIVFEAADGIEAIEKALEHKPDIIFMDLFMPELNGIEATRKILKTLPNTKIIACTTNEVEAIMFEAMEAGCCDYIKKPFTKHDLRNAIHTSLTFKKGESA